jgi:hypothetical protein
MDFVLQHRESLAALFGAEFVESLEQALESRLYETESSILVVVRLPRSTFEQLERDGQAISVMAQSLSRHPVDKATVAALLEYLASYHIKGQ